MTTVLGLSHLQPGCVRRPSGTEPRRRQGPPCVVYLAAALEGEVRVGERGVWTWVALNGNLRYGNPGQPGTACGTCLGSTDILPVKVLERNITVSLCGKSSKISRPQDRDPPAQSTHTPQPTQGTL